MNFYYELRNKSSRDRYIFFKDQQAVNNVLDIEISLRNYPNIKCLLVLEQNNPISILNSKIPETLEKFHKLSGVSYPKLVYLAIKRDKDKDITIQLDSDKTIEEIIKPGDVLIYDLQFKEIWVDVNLVNSSFHKKISLDFEIKINLDKSLLDLVCIIIKLAMKTFYLNKHSISIKEDYFLLDNFEMEKIDDLNNKTELLVSLSKPGQEIPQLIYSNSSIQLNNLDSPDKGKRSIPKANSKLDELSKRKLRDIFSLESKINCVIKYTNLNHIVYDYAKKKNLSSRRIGTTLVDKFVKNAGMLMSINIFYLLINRLIISSFS
jgi:hypothetical protein